MTVANVPRDGHAQLSYDAAGNQTRVKRADGSFQRFVYDAANRLVEVRNDANSVVYESYKYGVGNRRLVSESGGMRTYYAGGGGQSAVEYVEAINGGSLTWSKTFIYMGGSLLATISPNGASEYVEYHHPDRLGTRLTTNNLNASSYEQVSLPFGTALDAESTGATNRRFTSYDRSPSTGLDYAVNRTYDSAQGRFTQVDPIEMDAVDLSDPQSLNLYSYCGNDPVNHTDPDGLFFKKLFRGIWKILTSKWFLIAVMVALTVISIGANAGWWALSVTKGFNISSGLFCTIGAAGCLGGAWAVTQTTTLGYIAGGLAISAAIPGLTSVKGILSNAASYGAGLAFGGIGGSAGDGGTPGWNPENSFQRRGGGRRNWGRDARGRRTGPGSWAWGMGPARISGLRFRGLIQNRPLRELTDSEISTSFRLDTPFELLPHANQRLRDPRTAGIGVRTLSDYANHINGNGQWAQSRPGRNGQPRWTWTSGRLTTVFEKPLYGTRLLIVTTEPSKR